MPQLRHLFAVLTLVTSASLAEAQTASASDTPLHLAANRFQFVASGDTLPPPQPLRVHNGGIARFTDMRVTVAYADSAQGTAWLVALPRQTSVAPDELAAIATLCIDAAGLPAGTYRATAAVSAREVPAPVAVAITLVVTDTGAKAGNAAGHCGIAEQK